MDATNALRRGLRLALLAGACGLFAGAIAAPPTVIAGCEEDECEGGKQCVDNAGHNTSCEIEGSECVTEGC